MKKLKWTLNDISFNRSNYRPVIARFDNSKHWLGIPSMTTTSSARAMFRELANAYGATSVELKGRGITEVEAHWVDGCQKKIENWRSYRVTKAAFEKLKAQYPISMECCLD